MTLLTTHHVTYIAPAISCGHCVGKVQNAVRSLEGVVEVQASVETRFVDIDFDPSVVTPEAIEQALAAAGFPVQQ